MTTEKKTEPIAALERKIAAGWTLEEAATAAGVDIAEARTWAQGRLDGGKLDGVALHLSAHDAITTGLEILKKIAKAGPRFGDPTSTVHSTDLDAAKVLLRYGLDARKLAAGSTKDPKAGSGGGQLDLFDVRGPWDVEDPQKG